jgi:hypothetical protein
MVSQSLVCLMTGMLLVAAPFIHAQQKPPEPDPPKTETLPTLIQKPPEQDLRKTAITRHAGQIKSIKIDKCALQPGSYEGSITLAREGGAGEVTLAIRPGVLLKRGDQLVTIDELGVGNYIKVEAVQIPGQQLLQITILNVEPPEQQPLEPDPPKTKRP